MLKPSDVDSRLRQILRDQAGDDVTPDPKLAWDAFLAFARLPISSSCQILLFECTNANQYDPNFCVHFGRIYYIGGPHNVRAESVQLHFNFAQSPALASFAQDIMIEYTRAEDVSWTKKDPAWFATVEDFIREVGDLSELWSALKDQTPTQTIVHIDQ